VGDTMRIINTPGSKELPPTALSALGPDWADDSADGFRLVAGSVDTETQGVSPWEKDGARPQGQQRFIGTGINTSWTFNTKDGRCHLPDGAVINAIYATWTQRGRSGATYSYIEGRQSHSANADHESLPHPDLELHWTDADDVVNPLSPPSDPVQRRLQSPSAKSNFLAVSPGITQTALPDLQLELVFHFFQRLG